MKRKDADAPQLSLQFAPAATDEVAGDRWTSPPTPEPTPGTESLGPLPPEWETVVPGTKCEVISVHHPAFSKEIGKIVVIHSINSTSHSVWAWEDAPVTYRINARGRQVVQFDPSSVRTPYSMKQLRILPGTSRSTR